MELLVHTGAPASRANDKRFRAQALAYMRFQPSEVIHCNATSLTRKVLSGGDKQEQSRVASLLKQVDEQSQVFDAAIIPTTNPENRRESRCKWSEVNGHQMTAVNSWECAPLSKRSCSQRPKALQGDWHSDRHHGPCVSFRALSNRFVEAEDYVLDTPFADSALERQLLVQSNVRYMARSGPTSPHKSPKRRKLLEDQRWQEELGQTSSYAIPSETSESHFQMAADAQVDDELHGVRSNPKTPDPDSMNSLLPSHYELSLTTTEASDDRSQLGDIHHRGSVVEAVVSDSLKTSEQRGYPTHLAQPTSSSLVDVSTVYVDSSNIQVDPSAVATESLPRTARRPLQAVEPNSSPPKPDDHAVRSTSNHHGDVVSGSSSSPVRSITRKPILTHGSAYNASSSVVTSPTHPRHRHIPSLHSLPLEARSPWPPTAFAPAPPSQMTKKLKALLDLPMLASRYNPIKTTRHIAADERGRWEFSVDAADASTLQQVWPLPQQVRFWRSLCKLVEDGSLGSYTWCIRQPVGDDETRATVSVDVERGEALGRVRVFCWGEVVQSVWLLLYTLSNNKISKVDARWVDRKGVAVVHMPIKQALQ